MSGVAHGAPILPELSGQADERDNNTDGTNDLSHDTENSESQKLYSDAVLLRVNL
jgi:hypothetical protein